MRYFLIKEKRSSKSHTYPQVSGFDLTLKDAQLLGGIGNEPVDFSQLPPIRLYLDEDSSFTDLVSQSFLSARGLLISDHFFSVIEDYLNEDFQHAPAHLILGNEEKIYHWLHPICDYDQFIDFDRTSFAMINALTEEISEIKIKDYETLLTKRLHMSGLNKLITKEQTISFTKPLGNKHLFLFTLNVAGIYISESLAQIIKEKNFTGIEFIEGLHRFTK